MDGAKTLNIPWPWKQWAHYVMNLGGFEHLLTTCGTEGQLSVPYHPLRYPLLRDILATTTHWRSNHLASKSIEIWCNATDNTTLSWPFLAYEQSSFAWQVFPLFARLLMMLASGVVDVVSPRMVLWPCPSPCIWHLRASVPPRSPDMPPPRCFFAESLWRIGASASQRTVRSGAARCPCHHGQVSVATFNLSSWHCNSLTIASCCLIVFSHLSRMFTSCSCRVPLSGSCPKGSPPSHPLLHVDFQGFGLHFEAMSCLAVLGNRRNSSYHHHDVAICNTNQVACLHWALLPQHVRVIPSLYTAWDPTIHIMLGSPSSLQVCARLPPD